MSTTDYRGQKIRTAVFERPASGWFFPRAVIEGAAFGAEEELVLGWPDHCRSRREAEDRAIDLAKRVVDQTLGAPRSPEHCVG